MFVNRHKFQVVALASAIAFSTLPSGARAAGATAFTYSPIACRTFGGSLWIYWSGQISNRHPNETMRVFCPLIHEAKENHSGKLQIHVVQANQNHKDENGRVRRVECRAFFNHPHANPDPPWNYNDWDGNEAGSIGVETATITLPGARYLGGSHMLECTIPPKDYHVNYFDGESRIGTYKSGVD